MIDTVYNMGDDAFSNLFDISLEPISYIPDVGSTLLRVQNFTIPGTGTDTYEVHHKTQRITKPSGKQNDPKEFSFDIRVDRNWVVYRGLILWKNAVSNQVSGAVGADNPLSNNRANISVWAVTPTGIPIPGLGSWTFKGCFPQNVGDVSFDYTSGDPITVNVTMGFLVMDDLDI